MPPHVDWQFLVHCDTVAANDVANKDDYFKAIEDRYCAKYCVELGVEPLSHHKAYVARQAPLGECELEATWMEVGSVANKIKISQPQIGSQKETVKASSSGQRNAEWFGRATYMDVTPPEPPTEVAAHFDLAAQSKDKAMAEKRRMKTHAFASMQLQDLINSGKIDEFQGLTEELERHRIRVRSDLEDESGKADVFGRLLKSKGRRESDEKELENLKAKFLLPFACERTVTSHLLPWQSTEIRMHPHIHIHEDFMEDAKKPIALSVAT